MNHELSMKRLYLLMRCDVLLHARTLMLVVGTILGVLLLFTIFSPERAESIFAEPSAFLTVLFIAGFWLSSKAFRILHIPRLTRNYLLLPASQLEKFLSRLLLTSLGLVLFFLVIYFIFSLVVYGLIWVFYNISIPLFAVTSAKLWYGILIYCILQSVILLASIYFRSHCLLKLALTLVILKFGFFIFTILMSLIFFGHLIANSPFAVSQMVFAFPTTGHFFLTSFAWTFWLALAPFCWFVSYVRFKESEEAHGI